MQTRKLWSLGLFAVAMAYLEAAVVVYLRQLYGIDDLMTSVPPFDPATGLIEVGREAATLVMLLTVGWAAGKRFQSRLGFALFAFGLWDIFYYLWLRVFIGWPASLLSMDILFLIPLPWWGPVIAPVLIAALMAAGGLRLIQLDDLGLAARFRPLHWAALGGGILLVLYTFMTDALALLPADVQALSQVKPTAFNWPVYALGLVMAALAIWLATAIDE
ncbi:MAG: hypothetical protein U9R05_04410 [Chloroflexota bacterium]|nr:hypothetical protein [Chloroflexota bacterium]